MRVAIVSSNQHLNRYAGSTETEERWAQRVSAYCRPALERLGIEARIFWIAGSGSSNVDELRKALDQADGWGPDLVFSIHSDAPGASNKNPGQILMLAPRGMHDKAERCGLALTEILSMPYRGTWDYGEEARDIHFLVRYSAAGAVDALLAELGRHDLAAEAARNLTREREYGEACALAIAETYGIQTQEDDMTDPAVLELLQQIKTQATWASLRAFRAECRVKYLTLLQQGRTEEAAAYEQAILPSINAEASKVGASQMTSLI